MQKLTVLFLSSFLYLITYIGLKAQDALLPELEGFKKELNYQVFTPDNLWDYINGGADSYNTLGFQDLHIAEYTRGKKNTVKLEIYHHISSELAFGIYALERAPSYNYVNIGVQAYRGEGFLNFLKGEYYVKIYTDSKSKKALEAIDKLAFLTEQNLEGTLEFPEALKVFPSEGRLKNEEMYIAENVLGHEFLSNAFKASYKVDNKRFAIYSFFQENPETIAGMANTYLERQMLDTDVSEEGKTSFTDGYNGNIFLVWKGQKMVIISGLKLENSSIANNYISKIIK